MGFLTVSCTEKHCMNVYFFELWNWEVYFRFFLRHMITDTNSHSAIIPGWNWPQGMVDIFEICTQNVSGASKQYGKEGWQNLWDRREQQALFHGSQWQWQLSAEDRAQVDKCAVCYYFDQPWFSKEPENCQDTGKHLPHYSCTELK